MTQEPFPDQRSSRNTPTEWMGMLAALALLAGLLGTQYVVPPRYVLVQYLGLVPLVGAATLGWRRTGAIAVASVLAGLLAGHWVYRSLVDTDLLLRAGSVAACGVVAMGVAAVRQHRVHRLAEITAIAEVAEHAIVRSIPIALPDVEVATVYRSATTSAIVGGDLYEAVSSSYGSRLIIGDARGKGLPAVQMAAVVLGAFRHAALSEADLSQLVTDLDRTVAAFAGYEDFVTALIIEVDDRDVRLVCCGHPAPLIGPPGYVRAIPVEIGLPLGLGGPRVVYSRGWPTRQLLVAYTDGLVEARNSDGDVLPIEGLASSLETWEPEPAVERLMAALQRHVSGRLTDDLTILAMRRLEVDVTDETGKSDA